MQQPDFVRQISINVPSSDHAHTVSGIFII
jgi:hypothetical protein